MIMDVDHLAYATRCLRAAHFSPTANPTLRRIFKVFPVRLSNWGRWTSERQ